MTKDNDEKKVWRQKARACLAAAFGGKCTICGYDKTIAALDYHHVNPEEKDNMLSIAMRNGYAWSKIIEEARKCTIVCCRCHREIHAGVTKLPKKYAKFDEKHSDIIRLKEKEFDICPVCGKEKYSIMKYCSRKCCSYSQSKLKITKEELKSLIQYKSYEEIGKTFGVSGNAVKIRCKRMNILPGNRLGYWSKSRKKDINVSKEELEKLLQTRAVSCIAKMFNVGNEIVKRKIAEYELEIPNINWHQIAGRKRWKNKK